MANEELTLSQLAVKLIVDHSLDVIAGRAPAGQFPMQGGLRLSEARRAELGRVPGGSTLFYPAGGQGATNENGVFVDFQDATTTVWFSGAESRKAIDQLETTLKKAYPKTVKHSDKAHPEKRELRHRSYDVPLGEGRAAVLDVAFPVKDAATERFVVRIQAFAKQDKH